MHCTCMHCALQGLARTQHACTPNHHPYSPSNATRTAPALYRQHRRRPRAPAAVCGGGGRTHRRGICRWVGGDTRAAPTALLPLHRALFTSLLPFPAACISVHRSHTNLHACLSSSLSPPLPPNPNPNPQPQPSHQTQGTLSDFLKADLSRKYPDLMKYVRVTLLQSAQSILTTVSWRWVFFRREGGLWHLGFSEAAAALIGLSGHVLSSTALRRRVSAQQQASPFPVHLSHPPTPPPTPPPQPQPHPNPTPTPPTSVLRAAAGSSHPQL